MPLLVKKDKYSSVLNLLNQGITESHGSSLEYCTTNYNLPERDMKYFEYNHEIFPGQFIKLW